MTNLAVFEIDGTLTLGASNFDECFVRALVDFTDAPARWQEQRQATESASSPGETGRDFQGNRGRIIELHGP